VVRLLVAMGVPGRATYRRRAARARDFPRLVAMLSPDRGLARPLAHHQRLPARSAMPPRSWTPASASERLDRLLQRDRSSRSPAATRCRRCCRPRGAGAAPRCNPIKVNAVAIARLHRARGDPVRGVRPLHRLPGALHRVSCRSTAITHGPPTPCSPRRAARDHHALSDRRAAARALATARRVQVRRGQGEIGSSTGCPSRSAPTATAIRLTAEASCAPACSRCMRPTARADAYGRFRRRPQAIVRRPCGARS